MARGTAADTETTNGATSSRLVTGTMAMLGDGVATTEPAVEQTGQICDADGAAVQPQNADTKSLGLHVLTKTKLRAEWLWGQENHLLAGCLASNQPARSPV